MVSSASPVSPSKAVRNSGPSSTYPSSSRKSASGSPITVPSPSTVPSAVFQQLGPPVGVEVVQLGLGVVGTRADVRPQVDAPQLLPVYLDAYELDGEKLWRIEVHVPGGAGAGVVLRVARIPFHD